MKKTGKVLSLVLSLALVASSLVATTASAAVAGTEYLGASVGASIDLVNGASGDASKTDVTSKIKYTGEDGTTADHLTVGGMTATDVAMSSGRDLVSCEIDSQNSKVYLKLKDASATGSETLAVRYTATNHRYTNPSKDILFSKVIKYTVNVHKLNGYEVTADKTSYDKYGKYTAAGAGTSATMTQDVTVTVNKYDLATARSAESTDSTSKSTAATCVYPTAKGEFDAATAADGNVFVKVSSSNKVTYPTSGNTVTLTAPTGSDFLNQGSFVIYATPVTKSADINAVATLDTANTLTATRAVTNTVTLDTDHNAIKAWHGSSWAVASTDSFDEKTTGVADPLSSSKLPVAGAINVTNANVVLSVATTMDGSAIVGDVSGAFDFTMNSGYAKSVTNVAKFTLVKGNVGAVSATEADINGGTTGDVSATTVKLNAVDAKVPATVGKIAATDITIASKNAVVTTGAIKMTGTASAVDVGPAQGGTFTLEADKATIPAIDFDKYSTTLVLNGYVGQVAAPVNAENGTVTVQTNSLTAVKSDATLAGSASIKTVNLIEGTLKIATSLKADTISGAGTLVIPAGKLFINDSMTGISLKLSDAKIVPGMNVFSATAYKVYDGMFTPVGFKIDYDAVAKATTRTTDTFKVKEVNFAGLTIAPVNGTSNKIAKGQSATFKASSYPYGTALPENTKIKLEFSGSSDNFTSSVKDDTITITADKYDDLFASLNKGVISATLVSTDSDTPVYTCPVATYDVQMIEKPESKFKIDSVPSTMKIGQQYTVKITGTDATAPQVAFAGDFAIINSKTVSGYDTFVKFTAAKSGEHGVYVSGTKVAVIKVDTASICDTKTVTKKAGQSYTFKVTSSAVSFVPQFGVATVSGNIKPTKQVGKDFYYTVKATSAKGAHGVYINGVKVATYTFA